MKIRVTIFVGMILLLSSNGIQGGEPNPPAWPSSVLVFNSEKDSASEIQAQVDAIFAQNGGPNPPFNGQWSSGRYALLFQPGSYSGVTVNVGYYTSVVGLGLQPTDTVIGAVTCQNGDFDYSGGALSNFWRSAENFATKPTQIWNNGAAPSMMWAVSQACPLRRVDIEGDLSLFQYNYGCCAGYSSGGFMADMTVAGTVYSGSQQQFFTRNTQLGAWVGGNWNMVFAGNSPASAVPPVHCSNNNGSWPITSLTATPVIAEKPYLVYNATTNLYAIAVPPVQFNKVGPTTDFAAATLIDLSQVYVANAATDDGNSISQKLASGLHLILTPGIYNLSQPIVVANSNTVVLGLGFPTLVSTQGQPVLIVDGAAVGVRVAGLLLQAGPYNTSTLLQWGSAAQKATGDPNNPGFLYDCFARVGGTNDPSQYQVTADTMVIIAQDHVVIDNSWLWRADHDVSGDVSNSENPNLHGLLVLADDVTTYGLAVEHCLQDLVQWYGQNGMVVFFQSELPYDVTQQNFGDPGYVAFRIASNVTQFAGYGVGVYSYFRDYPVVVESAIVSPSLPSTAFVNSLTVFLNGQGQISHVINQVGASVSTPASTSYVCTFPS